MKSDFVGRKDGFDFICEADFIRATLGFHRALCDFIEKTTKISEENKKLILGENARSFYGFSDIPDPQKVKNMVED